MKLEEKELMSDQTVNPLEIAERLPTPEEVEKIMIQRELETNKALDGRAQLFALYMPRLKGQLNFMSKKQLVTLTTDLCKSEHTKNEDINRALNLTKNLNLNSLIRTIGNVIESPLHEHVIKQMSKTEKKLFDELEELFAQKYVTYVMNYVNNPPKEETTTPRAIEELVTYLPEKKAFDKREKVEKDAFATANQILLTKTLMMQHTLLEYLNENAKEVKNESVGSPEKVDEKNEAGLNSDPGIQSSELSQSTGEIGKRNKN